MLCTIAISLSQQELKSNAIRANTSDLFSTFIAFETNVLQNGLHFRCWRVYHPKAMRKCHLIISYSYNRHRNEWDGESAKALISFLKVTCATPYRKHTFRLQVAMQCLSLCSTTFSCFQKGIKFSPCIHLSLSRSNKILHGQISALVYVNLPKTFKNKEKCHSSWITWMFFLIRSHFAF